MAGDAGDLAGVVRLDAADRHQRVAALGERVGDEVLELAHLVAAERDARVAVLALGPDLDLAAERGAEPRQGMDRRRAEQQRDTGEVVEAHRRIVGIGRMCSRAADREPMSGEGADACLNAKEMIT